MRVFLNALPVDLAPGATVRDALAAHDAAMADQVAAGRAKVTDARGIDLPLDAPLAAGSILRVLVSARRGGAEDADADA
ncbi:MAG TPA: hypothetical protein VJQ44_04430 [Gemmatimonadales bacterium]|nr:hypothetical protein [Gemmatimonadales bacterium]